EEDNLNEEEIKRQILKADKLIKKLPIIMQNHEKKQENIVYTSKLIDTRGIVSEFEKVKSDQKPSKEVRIDKIDSNLF
ncbi:11231_t:CDS:1, partial [Cetraspora pellucida]